MKAMLLFLTVKMEFVLLTAVIDANGKKESDYYNILESFSTQNC